MNFEQSQISYIHLVSWPSVWLPPPSTQKILVHGLDQTGIDQLVSDLQPQFPNQNWAIYYDLDFDKNDQERLDWLLITAAHVQHIWFNVRDNSDVNLALFFHPQLNVGISSTWDASLSKLCDFASLESTSVMDFCRNIIEKAKKS